MSRRVLLHSIQLVCTCLHFAAHTFHEMAAQPGAVEAGDVSVDTADHHGDEVDEELLEVVFVVSLVQYLRVSQCTRHA